MNRIAILISAAVALAPLGLAADSFSPGSVGLQTALLAGGCFWSMQSALEKKRKSCSVSATGKRSSISMCNSSASGGRSARPL